MLGAAHGHSKRTILTAFCFLQALLEVEANSMKFKNVTSEWNPHYYKNFSAWIDPNGRLNMDFFQTKPFVYGYYTIIDFQITLPGSKRYQSMFSYGFEFCKMMNEGLQKKILRIWLQNFLKYGTLMQNCPIEAGQYHVNGMIMEAGSVPPYLQPGDYRVRVYNHAGKRGTKKEVMISGLIFDIHIFRDI